MEWSQMESSDEMEEKKKRSSTADDDDDSCSCGSGELLLDEEEQVGSEEDRYSSANSALGTPSSLGTDFFPPHLLSSSSDGGRAAAIHEEERSAALGGLEDGSSPLVMGSSVAFGCDDWDDFMRESDTPLYLYDDHPAWSHHRSDAAAAANDEQHVVPPAEPMQRNGAINANDELTTATMVESPLPPPPPPPLDACQEGKELQVRELEQANSVLLPSEPPHQDAGLHLEVNKLDVNDPFDDMVLEMEEILLNSGEPHGTRFPADSHKNTVQQSHHLRDGSSTASTSGTDDAYPLSQCPSKIDWVEVVGAKQRTGDVSFGERMVGVKEYTVYLLRVQSGKDEWEIERRYRDFFALYRQLKTFFIEKGLSLPSPWVNVEREASKIFGNASPNVVSERSDLIQDCLHSILVSSYPFGMPSPLVSFLSPGRPAYKYSFLKTLIPQSLQKLGDDLYSKDSDYNETSHEDTTSMGKTISLVVEKMPHKSTRQLLELQHYSCAGCHRHLEAGRTLLQEFAQTIGWNKPRFCSYTGQLFCASCHTNDTAVLPARVLHFWDFSLYPVSQLAKAYLESIYDQPMLCVSAVNPFLFSKVPALLHVMSIRKKIAAMLPYIRCPFRSSIQKGLGVRRYLLESNDFFALHDLVDLSKGAFAALPVMVQTISNRILEHITQQCLVCYDVGVPCAARQACDDPLSLIFPFQEGEATKCGSCGSIFHKQCFGKLDVCPCGKPTSTGRRIAPLEQARHGADGLSGELVQPQVFTSSSGIFSDILSKARPDKIWKPRNSNPVILMGSLPNTSI